MPLSGADEYLIKTDGSRVTAERIIVFTAKDASSQKTLEDGLRAYLTNVMEHYRNYLLVEIPKIENAVLRSNGLSLVLIISNDSTLASDALDAVRK